MAVVKLTAENFEQEVLKSDKPVLVDFYADWCGPCKRLGLILEEIDTIDVLKVNVDLFQNISNKYGVMSIPTLIVFDKGNEIKKSIGFKTKNELLEFIN